ncbi:VOC family protein [Kribbella sp. NPDC056951]|uniref:VOC family protein n=1 Tax=Kribbella sp. NPDC056951 TaxID=3345978 RepID=UPI00363943C6
MAIQELRFRAAHLRAVLSGAKRITMRFQDPVEVGPAVLVFESEPEVRLPGVITSVLAKTVATVSDDEAREDGFPGADAVLAGLRDYYPALEPDDELVIVRFDIKKVTRPQRMHTALDAEDARGLAEFYRQLMGLQYRPGDEPPTADDDSWLVLVDADGRRQLAVQRADVVPRSTWPSPEIPMQMHLDFAVPTAEALELHRLHAEQLGARVLLDRTQVGSEPLYVLADPAGHPFCLLVGVL